VPIPTSIDAVLDCWIGPAGNDPAAAKQRGELWYLSSPEADEALRDKFGEALSQAEQGKLDGWQETPEGSLALVILLDQFSRNLYRGTAKAFANDPRAVGIAEQAIAREQHLDMSLIGRAFLYHPFEHSESLAHQERSVLLFRELAETAPAEWQERLTPFLEYAEEHCDVIRRFGRFPHRNKVLSRTNTAEEQAYLDGGARRYGQ